MSKVRQTLYDVTVLPYVALWALLRALVSDFRSQG